jgi:hypothetical protein
MPESPPHCRQHSRLVTQPDVLTAAMILGIWASLGVLPPHWILWRAPVIWTSGTAPHVLRFLITCFAPGNWCEAAATSAVQAEHPDHPHDRIVTRSCP